MTEPLHILLFAAIGALIAAGFFGLLYLTVMRQAKACPVGPFFFIAQLARYALAGVALWFVAQQGAVALISALAGFSLVLISLLPLMARRTP
jgi:hypothetical protein